MKILFITHYSEFYGANKSMFNLILDLKFRYSVTPVVLCPYKGPLTNELQKYDIPFIPHVFYTWETQIEKQTLKDRLKMLYNKIVVSNKLAERFRYEEVDIVHSNSSIFDIGQLIADKLQVPHIWHLREYGNLDYGFRYIPSIRYVRKTYKKATKLIAISDSIKDYYYNLCPDGSFTRIYNGIKKDCTEKFFKENYDTVQFVCVGLMSRNKNQLEILQACKLLSKNNYKNYVVNFIGDGDEEYLSELNEYIEKNGLKGRVKLWGYRSDVEDLLVQMDVGIMSSKNEAFGRVTIEYMMAGIPVIGTNSGGTKEIINNGYGGFLYNSGDFNSLYEKMKYFLENNRQILIMGKQAKEWANMNYSLEANTDAIYTEYMEICR